MARRPAARSADVDASRATGEVESGQAIEVHLDRLLELRGMTLTSLSEQVGVTLANLSVLKNGRARAIRFSTLEALCRVLQCQPGDLLTVSRDEARETFPER